MLTSKEFTQRARNNGTPDPRLFITTRDETAVLTEEIAKVEREIDDRAVELHATDLHDA